MDFIITREKLLHPLRQLVHLFVNRPILPILNNILLRIKKNFLFLVSTDLEIEIVAKIFLQFVKQEGETTIPARKLFSICRSLPKGSNIHFFLQKEKIKISSGYNNYVLSVLPAINFPNLENWNSKIECSFLQKKIKNMIELTKFSMGYQDVRYYLNGTFFETKENEISLVSSDGHRLSICKLLVEKKLPVFSVIIPRKGILELNRILNNNEDKIKLQIGRNNIKFSIENYFFTSKLIEGIFPNYDFVVSKNYNKKLIANSEDLKKAFTRVSVISDEINNGVILHLTNNKLIVRTNNSIQEKAEETLNISYQGEETKIGFNVRYILDVLNVLKQKEVTLLFSERNDSIKIEDKNNIDQKITYIIMPIRL